jgi:hypothetical protein
MATSLLPPLVEEVANFIRQPSLEAIAAALNLGKYFPRLIPNCRSYQSGKIQPISRNIQKNPEKSRKIQKKLAIFYFCDSVATKASWHYRYKGQGKISAIDSFIVDYLTSDRLPQPPCHYTRCIQCSRGWEN